MSDEDGYDGGADDFGQENYEDEYMMVKPYYMSPILIFV